MHREWGCEGHLRGSVWKCKRALGACTASARLDNRRAQFFWREQQGERAKPTDRLRRARQRGVLARHPWNILQHVKVRKTTREACTAAAKDLNRHQSAVDLSKLTQRVYFSIQEARLALRQPRGNPAPKTISDSHPTEGHRHGRRPVSRRRAKPNPNLGRQRCRRKPTARPEQQDNTQLCKCTSKCSRGRWIPCRLLRRLLRLITGSYQTPGRPGTGARTPVAAPHVQHPSQRSRPEPLPGPANTILCNRTSKCSGGAWRHPGRRARATTANHGQCNPRGWRSDQPCKCTSRCSR